MYSSDRPGSVPLYNMFSCLIGVLARGKGKLCDVLLLIFLLTGCLWMVSKTNTNIIFKEIHSKLNTKQYHFQCLLCL